MDDARAFFRGELKTLDADLRVAAAREPPTATTRLHLEDVRMQIARALDPAVQETRARSGGNRAAPLTCSTSTSAWTRSRAGWTTRFGDSRPESEATS